MKEDRNAASMTGSQVHDDFHAQWKIKFHCKSGGYREPILHRLGNYHIVIILCNQHLSNNDTLKQKHVYCQKLTFITVSECKCKGYL